MWKALRFIAQLDAVHVREGRMNRPSGNMNTVSPDAKISFFSEIGA